MLRRSRGLRETSADHSPKPPCEFTARIHSERNSRLAASCRETCGTHSMALRAVHREVKNLVSLAISCTGRLVQHSHTAKTSQPAFRRARLFLLSRLRVSSHLSRQNREVVTGFTRP